MTSVSAILSKKKNNKKTKHYMRYKLKTFQINIYFF